MFKINEIKMKMPKSKKIRMNSIPLSNDAES